MEKGAVIIGKGSVRKPTVGRTSPEDRTQALTTDSACLSNSQREATTQSSGKAKSSCNKKKITDMLAYP